MLGDDEREVDDESFNLSDDGDALRSEIPSDPELLVPQAAK